MTIKTNQLLQLASVYHIQKLNTIGSTMLLMISLLFAFSCNIDSKQSNQEFSLENISTIASKDSLELYLSEIDLEELSVLQRIQFHYKAGTNSMRLNNFEAGIAHFYQGLQLIDSESCDTMYAKYMFEIAGSEKFETRESLNKALEFLDRAKSQIEKCNISNEFLANYYCDKARSYLLYNEWNLGDTTFAFVSDSALVNFEKAKAYSQDPHLLSIIDVNSNYILYADRNFEELINKVESSLEPVDGRGEHPQRLTLLFYQSLAYMNLGNFDKSAEVLDTIENIVKSKGLYKTYESNIVSQRLDYYKLKGDWETAYIWKDSLGKIQDEELRQNEVEVLEKYEAASLENRLGKEKEKRFRTQVFSLILGLVSLIIIGGVLLLYRITRLNKERLSLDLENTKIKAAYQATLAKAEGEEQERRSIAATLHDQVASLLTAAGMHLAIAKKQSNDEAPTLKKAESIIKDVHQQVRDLSHQLTSPVLAKLGLKAAVESIRETMTTPALEISGTYAIGTDRFDQNRESFIFRTCAELVQNIHKHSNATEAEIALSDSDNIITLSITDNGTTENPPVPNKPLGLGLTNIAQKAEAYGGGFEFRHERNGVKAKVWIEKQGTN